MKGTIITKKGLQLIAKLTASREVLMFSRAVVGTGIIPEGKLPEDMEELVRYQMDGSISSITSSGNRSTVIFQVSSLGVPQEFTITEAGLCAVDPDEGEILYSYLDMSEDPQHIYAEGAEVAKFFETDMTVIIGTVESISAFMEPRGLVTHEKLETELDKKVDKVEGKGLSANDYTNAEKVIVNRVEHVTVITLAAASWTGSAPAFSQTVSVPGLTADLVPGNGIIYPAGCTRAQQKAIGKAAGLISRMVSGNGNITITCTERPAVDITIGLRGV